MKPDLFKLPLFICFFILPFIAYSQSKTDLEKKKAKLEEDIKYINQLKSETEKDKELSLNSIVTLNKKISIRRELITTISKEVSALNNNIKENEGIIHSLEEDLAELKRNYAQTIYQSYVSRQPQNRLLYLFSAEDFSQAYRRLKYLQEFTLHRKRQAESIIYTREMLNRQIEGLELQKKEKETLLGEQNKEKEILANEKTEKNKTLSNLKKKEKELVNELKKKQRDADKLQKAIEDIIAEEIRKAKERAEKSGKAYALTPEQKELSVNFENNKGKLPWPCERGIITGNFGEQPHPVLPGIMIKNNGVDISTNKDMKARVAFQGEITAVISIPGANKAVVVSHGEYRSVYSNLGDVYVKVGDRVKTKQEIGKVVTDASDNKTVLHFEIWKWDKIQDPKYWLYIR